MIATMAPPEQMQDKSLYLFLFLLAAYNTATAFAELGRQGGTDFSTTSTDKKKRKFSVTSCDVCHSLAVILWNG